ncbi:MAG TPA: biosynthetic peptidoglycan transglycosylase [Thermoanaerobaculaceae bacterium]|nr:biosynthetic peptidoglycan transglycosylase [Thermoanaerobaculaceae bacterium]
MTVRRAVWWCLAGLPVATVAAFAAWWWQPASQLAPWRKGPPPHPWAEWTRQEQRWREEGIRRPIEHGYVPLGEISPQLQLAVLVGEDIDFFGHGAVDLREVWDVIETARPGERLRGASTITQQLARSLFLSPERTLWRKLRELRLAWWLDRRLGKRRVLELYLNVVEFGPGVYGAEAAARHYLGGSARSLDAGQAAGLAAAIPAPSRDNPATGSGRWEARRGVILNRMSHADWLRSLLASLPGNARD